MKKLFAAHLFFGASICFAQCQQVTYYNDIKAIFSQNCTTCHRAYGTAPFSLESLEKITAYKSVIGSVVERGIMPPWRPDPGYTHFVDERVLSISDRQKVVNWIHQGCPAGTPGTDNTAQQNNGKDNARPDLILKLPFTIEIPAGMNDTTVLAEMPYEIGRDTFISSFQFIPARNSGIHHVFISLLDWQDAHTDPDPADVGKGRFWDGRAYHERSFSSDHPSVRGGWVPGQSAISMPAHVGWQLPKKGMLQYQLHYGPSPVAFKSNFELWLTYAKGKVERIALGLKYGSNTSSALPYPPLVIPPDSVMRFVIDGELNIDSDHSIIAISPHMHLLGKSVKAWLLRAGGDTVRLIYIPDWDFNQQEYYYLPGLVKAQKGDRLQVEVLMDNTANNIHNPNKPAKFVSYGPDTKDEMIQFSVYSIPYRKGDELFHAKINY